ncbi:hypothetical protein JMUB7529_28520 [Staphylococcus aureus]
MSSQKKKISLFAFFLLTVITITLKTYFCLLYTSDAADEGLGVDLGGRRIIKKYNQSLIHI